jgi:hypothetical protein
MVPRKGEPAYVDGMLHGLWEWAFVHAQDGSLEGITDVGLSSVCSWLGSPEDLRPLLISCGFLETDERGERIAKWKDWGGAMYTEEALADGAARQRAFRERQKARGVTSNAVSRPVTPKDLDLDLEVEEELQTHMSDSSESDCFDSFWKSYPRREAKAGAHSLWLKMSNTDRLAALTAVKHYATWCKANRDSLVMMPTTFLSKTGRRWEEWLNGPPAGRSNGAARPAPVEKPLCRCGATLTVDEEGVHCPMCGWRQT